MTTARIDTQQAARSATSPALRGGTSVKSRGAESRGRKVAKDKYQQDPQWRPLGPGAAVKRAFMTTAV